jgi:hypothetical protein
VPAFLTAQYNLLAAARRRGQGSTVCDEERRLQPGLPPPTAISGRLTGR